MNAPLTLPLRLRRRRARGFTLVELSVALVAGLIVGIAVVGLSKEATNTFHEEARTASAETALRAAIERIRADLSRASYMSTPNIVGDPTLVYSPSYSLAAQPLQIQRMAGVRLYNNGSVKNNKISASTTFLLSGTDQAGAGLSALNYPSTGGGGPDAIDITGNLNSTEMYSIGTVTAGAAAGGACSSGSQIVFNHLNPAGYRLGKTPPTASNAGAIAELAREFQPVAGSIFPARIVDATGHTQYVQVCNTGYTATNQPFVSIVGNPIEATGTTTQGGLSGNGGGNSTINPVLTVRYRLSPTVAPYAAELNQASDASKFDLYRVYIDVAGAEVGTPELIAEYVVDLKFAFTVDTTGSPNTGVACPAPTNSCPPYAPNRTHTSYGFGGSVNATWAPDVSGAMTTQGPQRIRSVRVRLATRTAMQDRPQNLAPQAYEPPDFLFRYCIDTASGMTLGNCKKWARVRTVVTEVALNNQSKALYP